MAWGARFLDVFLWWQLVRVWVFAVGALAIVFVEKVGRLVFSFFSLFIPVAVLDFLRAKLTPRIPRLLRGYKDTLDMPELRYDTPSLVKSMGYICEEHFVENQDGFLLCMHRIPCGKAQSVKDNVHRPAVYLQHGFLQSSESWVSTAHSLPFFLADRGFDVWIGNARGNKYSCHHSKYDPHQEQYWDFCLDAAAMMDIPTFVDFIIRVTQQPQIGYIGFSQGTAVGFGALSMDKVLDDRISLFVALAPATAIRGFSNPLVDALTRASPELLYLIMGKRDLLPMTLFWQRVLSTKVYVQAIDWCCTFLFGWDMRNITPEDKVRHYAHIYSYSSVKTVVHWFQCMKNDRFQMYDGARWRAHDKHMYVSPRYPLEQIKTPIALFYGGRDTIPDTPKVIDGLPKTTRVFEVPSYEHMDFMYSRSSHDTVYPKVAELLHAAAKQTDALLEAHRITIPRTRISTTARHLLSPVACAPLLSSSVDPKAPASLESVGGSGHERVPSGVMEHALDSDSAVRPLVIIRAGVHVEPADHYFSVRAEPQFVALSGDCGHVDDAVTDADGDDWTHTDAVDEETKKSV